MEKEKKTDEMEALGVIDSYFVSMSSAKETWLSIQNKDKAGTVVIQRLGAHSKDHNMLSS